MNNQGGPFKGPLPDPALIEKVSALSLREFVNIDTAIRIESVFFKGDIWFVSNRAVSDRVTREIPTAITYTARELYSILKGNPTKKEIEKIHDLKSVFPRSKLISPGG